MDKKFLHRRINLGLWIILALVFPFSVKLSSALLILWCLNWLLEGGFREKKRRLHFHKPILFATASFFLFLAIRSLLEDDALSAFKVSERKTAFILLPTLALSFPKTDENEKKAIVYSFSLLMLALTFYLLIDAFIRYTETFETSQFLYHQLGSPFGIHAVYLSALCIINLILIEGIAEFPLRIPFQLWILGILVLLSSKIMLTLGFICLLYFLIKRYNKTARAMLTAGILVLISLSTLIIFTENHVSRRFRDLSVERMKYLSQDYIGEGVYLDGLSLRLLQLRFASEIAGSGFNWLWGVGPGSTQSRLDEKYYAVKLYAPKEGPNRGYIGLNFHNQFAESMVQGGIGALILLVLVFVLFVRRAWEYRSEQLFLFTLVYLLFCLTESVFERQAGVFSFLIFGMWLWKDADKGTNSHKTSKTINPENELS